MPKIFSIGYGNRTFKDFVELLKHYKIDYLIDVRSQPYSKRYPDFSQKRLSELSLNYGVRYVWMGDTLGGRPNDPDCYTNDGKVDYEKCAAKEFYLAGIARLKNAVEQQLNVVIMCSEIKPQECHRSKLIGETLVKEGISVFHIDENGKLKPHEIVINDLISSLAPAQPTQLHLFDDSSPKPTKLTSRKSYRLPTKSKDGQNEN
jgi:uncharacterized protein (DUF488 family)